MFGHVRPHGAAWTHPSAAAGLGGESAGWYHAAALIKILILHDKFPQIGGVGRGGWRFRAAAGSVLFMQHVLKNVRRSPRFRRFFIARRFALSSLKLRRRGAAPVA